jgi:2,3-bisphosphoglycerate-dependent phosphoglycerate mutase
MTDLMYPSQVYDITLLRHGESLGNFEGLHQGQADFPLTSRGREQIMALVERWKAEAKSFDLVISSPLLRAQQTAEIITTGLSLPLELEPLWMERDNGLLSGMTEQEARETIPQSSLSHPYIPMGETGESLWELYLRAGQAVQSLFNHPPGNYLVVSHGGILNMFFYAILGIPPQPSRQGPRFRLENSAFATLKYDPAHHNWFILGLNDHIHWNSIEDS